MPLGFERINERTTRPNALINFIKPLSNAPSTALDILNAVAARCYPIMKANHIAVMSLEEYPPNPEFVGRNFNAGEVIQLVLKTRDGRWLGVKQVEMVMMHELAHCKQMNHSKSFWQVRDAYAGELRGLWAKDYRGEGLWGRGRELIGGALVNEGDALSLGDVQSLCGGTFRSRGKKRKRGKEGQNSQLSYAERKQRRILRKFGAGGTALGGDEGVKMELEAGKKVKGKPRVAKSARGRELRAAAALARFEKPKGEEDPNIKTEYSDDLSESDYDEDNIEGDAAMDINGKELKDEKGNGLVKVCEDEDQDDVHVKQEMDELQELRQIPITRFTELKHREEESNVTTQSKSKIPAVNSDKQPSKRSPSVEVFPPTSRSAAAGSTECAVCSLVNEQGALRCLACANVLVPERVPGRWKCKSLPCRGGVYVNAGDCGICGVCGESKPSKS
ncbi:WLM-domain-containing protein [Saccharata proteae CBS 121410]|uniref:WLM-domain-containing protein n=1 Tax=Saccharata proteae CBS 121410 TaxID=1314787 RepID=A0A9P4HUC1_9PEZI|nr:WLM-domain-containing protein [Saccharata proteae CBS 121410]